MGVTDRLKLIPAYLSRTRDFSIGTHAVASGALRQRCTRRAQRFIDHIDPGGDHLEVFIGGRSMPLCWPRELPLFDLHKVITECFDERDWHFYEVPETTVQRGDSVLDCGAAEGVFSLRVLDRAGRITAFEPLPLFAASLERTFASCPQVTVRRQALGALPGHARLNGSSVYGRLSESGEGIDVEVTTVDTWAAETGGRCDFLKGDLESGELAALQGALLTIERYRPRIAITVYHPGNDWHQLVSLVRRMAPRYRFRLKGLSCNGGRARPVMLHLWHP